MDKELTDEQQERWRVRLAFMRKFAEQHPGHPWLQRFLEEICAKTDHLYCTCDNTGRCDVSKARELKTFLYTRIREAS